MALGSLPAGIQSWLLFSLQLYSALQPDADGTLGSAAAPPASSNSLRYNQIQAVGTHNSYHVTPDNAILKLLTNPSTESLLGTTVSEEIPSSWEATQAPLGTQILDYGIRQIELDCYPDPQGGLFNSSAGARLAGENGFISLQQPELNNPGWKVLHVPDIDFNNTAWTFLNYMHAIRNYTQAVPDHAPLAVYIEFKTDGLNDYIGTLGEQLAPVLIQAQSAPGPDTYVRVLNITEADVLALHQEVLSVIPQNTIITPDQLRGNASSLKEALVTGGAGNGTNWPNVDDMRGKILFVVINTFTPKYLAQFPGLKGALFFVSDIGPSTDDVVFLEPANNEYDTTDEINAAAARVKNYTAQGYMVRVRTDYNTLEARSNSTQRTRALAAAGAHFMSTDFPSLPTYFNSTFQVRLPDGFICNPLTTNTSLGDLSNTLGTTASSSGIPSDATPVCS